VFPGRFSLSDSYGLKMDQEDASDEIQNDRIVSCFIQKVLSIHSVLVLFCISDSSMIG